MKGLPFTSEQFFQVFRSYNEHIWPGQLALVALALIAVWCAADGRRPRLAWLILGLLWSWCGVAYHWLHFASINRAALGFGALFVIEGVLLLVTAARDSVPLRLERDAAGVLGAVLMGSALLLYPLIGEAAGQAYLESPTFGLPCPLTIFTFGFLLWSRPRVPIRLLVVPVLWALLGSSAIVAFGVWQDGLMPVAALLAIAARVLQRGPARAVTAA